MNRIKSTICTHRTGHPHKSGTSWDRLSRGSRLSVRHRLSCPTPPDLRVYGLGLCSHLRLCACWRRVLLLQLTLMRRWSWVIGMRLVHFALQTSSGLTYDWALPNTFTHASANALPRRRSSGQGGAGRTRPEEWPRLLRLPRITHTLITHELLCTNPILAQLPIERRAADSEQICGAGSVSASLLER